VAGTYTLVWNQDVSSCYPSLTGYLTPSFIEAAGFSGSSMFVFTFNQAGTTTDEPFYVSVIC
jgi:hypothetical protein